MKMLEVSIATSNSHIYGNLNLANNARSLVIFAHGSGSSRLSSRNKFVADFFNQHNISTFLFDLLTKQEDIIDQLTRQFRFDIPLLAHRLVLITEWLKNNNETSQIKLGYFGASTGAAAALIAAAQLPQEIKAVVSRGGRPDLAGTYLKEVKSATLLLVGEFDNEVILLNKNAFN